MTTMHAPARPSQAARKAVGSVSRVPVTQPAKRPSAQTVKGADFPALSGCVSSSKDPKAGAWAKPPTLPTPPPAPEPKQKEKQAGSGAKGGAGSKKEATKGAAKTAVPSVVPDHASDKTNTTATDPHRRNYAELYSAAKLLPPPAAFAEETAPPQLDTATSSSISSNTSQSSAPPAAAATEGAAGPPPGSEAEAEPVPVAVQPAQPPPSAPTAKKGGVYRPPTCRPTLMVGASATTTTKPPYPGCRTLEIDVDGLDTLTLFRIMELFGKVDMLDEEKAVGIQVTYEQSGDANRAIEYLAGKRAIEDLPRPPPTPSTTPLPDTAFEDLDWAAEMDKEDSQMQEKSEAEAIAQAIRDEDHRETHKCTEKIRYCRWVEDGPLPLGTEDPALAPCSVSEPPTAPIPEAGDANASHQPQLRPEAEAYQPSVEGVMSAMMQGMLSSLREVMTDPNIQHTQSVAPHPAYYPDPTHPHAVDAQACPMAASTQPEAYANPEGTMLYFYHPPAPAPAPVTTPAPVPAPSSPYLHQIVTLEDANSAMRESVEATRAGPFIGDLPHSPERRKGSDSDCNSEENTSSEDPVAEWGSASTSSSSASSTASNSGDESTSPTRPTN